MPWNATWPLGAQSVKANRNPGQQNTAYIKATMGGTAIGINTNSTRDHFWDIGSDEDGRHRFINSPAFTVGGNPADPVGGSGMDAVLYLKQTNAQFQWFTKAVGSGLVYQVSPNTISGTVVLSGSYANVSVVPANVYGDIVLWTTAGRHSAQNGFFRSNASKVEAWANYLGPESEGSSLNLKLGNGSDSPNFNIRARTQEASSGQVWQYRITYRAI